MKLFSLLTFLFALTINSYSQDYFEGEINYTTAYTSLNPSIPTDFLETELGTSFTAYIKEDRYVMLNHATGEKGWAKVTIRLDQGYSYTETEKSDTIVKSKFGNDNNELLKFKRNTDDKKEVLGTLCESVTISYKPINTKTYFHKFNGTYYFDPQYKLNVELYKNYTDGYWNLFVEESGAISIRNETEYFPLFKVIQEAISIEKKEIPLHIFEPNPSKVIVEK